MEIDPTVPVTTAWSRRLSSRGFWTGVHALAAGAIVLLACSSNDSAEDSTSSSVPAESAATSTSRETTAPAQALSVSYDTDVRPILESSCASCHQAGGPGASHLQLDTAGNAADAAQYIGTAANTGYMPPWPAGDGGVALQHDRRLSDAELETIGTWIDEGGLLDVPRETALTPTAQAITPIERDAVMTGAPYKGSTALPDDYRCQIYDPAISETQYLQGFGLEADRTEVVHHALVFRASEATRPQNEAADAADPAAGWPCSGLAVGGSNGEVKQIMSWGPGQEPTVLPADTAIAMEPGDYFITQIHYHYGAESERLSPDESALVADFASDEVIAAAGGQLEPIDLTLYVGPVEIPCSTDQSGPLCDRTAAQQDAAARIGVGAASLSDGLLRRCGTTAADYAGMVDGKASSTCDQPATPGQVVSIWGHMHELGSSYRMTLNPGTPEEKVLLDIPKWSFDWQLNYSPVEDIVLDSDDVIRVECSYDRSLAEHGEEPRYIMWSEATNDEMCYSQIVTRPAPEGTQ
jgi:mono/diheme cytochrome c family protein